MLVNSINGGCKHSPFTSDKAKFEDVNRNKLRTNCKENPLHLYLQIDQGALGLSREYLSKGFEDKIVKAYYEYMVDIAVIYGADRSRAERELKESVEFEMKLANVSMPSDTIFLVYSNGTSQKKIELTLFSLPPR